MKGFPPLESDPQFPARFFGADSPQRAVTEVQGRTLVAVVGTDHKVKIVPVKTGERVGPQWVVQGNIKVGDQVVSEGLQKLREGAEVTPTPYVPKTASLNVKSP